MPLIFIRLFVPPFQNIKMFDFIDTDAYKVYNIRWSSSINSATVTVSNYINQYKSNSNLKQPRYAVLEIMFQNNLVIIKL